MPRPRNIITVPLTTIVPINVEADRHVRLALIFYGNVVHKIMSTEMLRPIINAESSATKKAGARTTTKPTAQPRRTRRRQRRTRRLAGAAVLLLVLPVRDIPGVSVDAKHRFEGGVGPARCYRFDLSALDTFLSGVFREV